MTALIWVEGLLPQRAEAAVKSTPTAPAAPAGKTDLGSINESLEGQTVEIEANVKSILPPREGSKAPVRINLTDATGSMTLVVWADIFDVIKTQSPMEVGSTIHATARVSKYKDNLQLQIKSPTDIKSVTKPAAAESHTETPSPAAPAAPASDAGEMTPVANITKAMMSHDVIVKGTITDIREPRSEKAPYIVTISQDDAHIPLVFWSDLQQQIKQGLKVGNTVRVKAQVGEHRDTLQIKLRNAADFSVVNAAE